MKGVDYIIGEFHTFDHRNFADFVKMITDLGFSDLTNEFYPPHPMKGQMFAFLNRKAPVEIHELQK